MKNCAHCNWGLATLTSEVELRFIELLSLFDHMQGRIGGRKAGRLRPEKSPLDQAVWEDPGELNAMKNCVHCIWGLSTLPGEVDVRFIALLSLFHRTQGRIGGRKAGRLT